MRMAGARCNPMSLLLFPRYLGGGLLLAACGLLVPQLLQVDLWPVAALAGVLGLVWLLALWQCRPALVSPCFIGLCLVNGAGVIAQEAVTPGLFCQVLLLGSWDLHYLSSLVESLVDGADLEGFVMRHLRRLAVVLISGLALAWASLQLPLSLPLVPALLIGFAGIFTLYWFIGSLKKMSGGA